MYLKDGFSLEMVNLERVFEPAFGNVERVREEYSCSRIDSIDGVPESLKRLFEENSENLDSVQKSIFAAF